MEDADVNRFDLSLGAIIAILDNLLIIGILAARVAGRSRGEYWLGLVLIASVVPLGYLLVASVMRERPVVYIGWIALGWRF